MALFDVTQAAAAQAAGVQVTRLVEADFASGVTRVWEGYGTLTTADAKTWSGLGELLDLGDLTQVTRDAAASTTFSLSGVDASVVAAAVGAETEAAGRLITVYLQFLTGGAPLGVPLALATLRMDQVSYSLSGDGTRRVSITAEGLLANRRRVPFGRYTPQDQKVRYPGDLGLDQVPTLADKAVAWPDY